VTDKPFFVLLPTPQSELAEEFDLPDNDDNLFQRIIRNPHIEASNPRERECTEMLCAVLRNTSALRLSLLRWMAELIGVKIKRFDDLQFVIETEGAIGSKRDDLRIEGWIETEDDRQQVLLWTVEVKVGASFHESSPLDGLEINVVDAGLVNQICNYDHWLEQQTAEYRAGFVLALENMTESLPLGLKCQWRCFSWTGLGVCLQDNLKDGKLPKEEEFLAKHLLGFISKHLWRNFEMSDTRLGFDDVALLRAFYRIGRDCEDKVNKFVELLKSLLIDQNIGHGDVTHEKVLYKASLRSTVYRNLFDPSLSVSSYIVAGIANDKMTLWLETAQRDNRKITITAVLESCFPMLIQRNPAWRLNDKGGWDIKISQPLTSLLVAPDQVSEFSKFFVDAIEDIREARIIECLHDRLAESS